MRWQPAHETHAIERVTVTLMFAEHISTKPWQMLLPLATRDLSKLGFQAAPDAPQLAQNLPQSAPGVAQLVINIGANPVAFGNVGGGIPFSRNFQYIEAGEARDEIIVARNMFLFTTTFYGGWASLRNRFAEALNNHISIALNTVNIGAIKIEYWDRFVSEDSADAADYKGLLDIASKYVPKFGFETEGLWHSHVGLFVEPGSSERRLVNLNIDVVDIAEAPEAGAVMAEPAQKRSVGIYSMVQDTPRPGAPLESAAAIYSTLDEMHTILKVVLADAITDAASDRIALNP
ncbi:hypothetical protein FV232_19770 [Methylobacterium sp. WL30]|uniref:hypothetical protein n=1 Tax=unclassified Methylobacterium TaxID=2615210 RepID=UPI0011C80D31|nr:MULTISPECIES: hypothetical protein [unclassified Methylobacterium]TXN41415.1 hypothetical protein FV225_02695 [Methylobacterium sp. WL93]TXN49797.1 hypothetical protein FV227_14985 [Methylobacterium sp. WL119]TXN64864.1 hypothetical protein FV232_19770 [Methylobacterium sp. WL30]